MATAILEQPETTIHKRPAEKISGMGAIPHDAGVAFRVWAPHADEVHVVGSFNDWNRGRHPMERENNGYWYADIEDAEVGDEYKFSIRNGDNTFDRIDPYAREVTNSIGNGVVQQSAFTWDDKKFRLPPWNELVLYETHVGTYGRKNGDNGDKNSNFDGIEAHFDHLEALGVNVIQLMPTAEFAGDVSWGYNPAHIFAVESAYGGPFELKDFVDNAHARGFGVILDVVYNHFGPSDIDLWQFDGWNKDGMGGIYFYNDWRAKTPWGETRPDYGRGEVRQFIFDNAMMWLDEYHMDGLRMDMTFYMRAVSHGGDEIPAGWGLIQWINREVQERFPGRLTIAEDLQNNEYLTRETENGGAGFGAQWDAKFVHPVRAVIQTPNDQDRSMEAIKNALTHRYNQDSFERVIYTESHDEVANGKSRVPQEIAPDDPDNWFAQKRSTLGAVLMLTAPGIPMLFQGQEFLQGDWFDDEAPLNWHNAEDFAGIVNLYRDLIRLRRNMDGDSRGLIGQHICVHHVNDGDKVIAFHRWNEGGPGDDVVVILNFANHTQDAYDIGFPHAGKWTLRLNTDWSGYSDIFTDHPTSDIIAPPNQRDGYPATGTVSLGPYSAIIYTQSTK